MQTKILIVGCGLAGLSAAITAADLGCEVTVLSPYPPERAQSVLAAGGINAAVNTKGEDDSPAQHCAETMKAGAYLADELAVREMTETAPALIAELDAAGVVFSRDAQGRPDVRYFGGQSKKRTVFAKAGIGKQLVSGLSSVLLRYTAEKKITLLTGEKMIKCVFDGGRYAGVISENTASGALSYHPSDALIAASGGLGGLFGKTTGSKVSDGSVSASLFASGIEMGNLEMIQYHPTTVETAQKRMLISEAARGEGGRLFTERDGRRWYFMEDWYGERGNLMPRDIVSQCIYKVCVEMGLGLNGAKQVGLDLTHLGEAVVHDRLKEITDTAELYLGIDPAKEIIPVYPGVHYFMGGINTDRNHRTSIPGIYAAGECACIYHGANRLGGNSTLGAVYGGKTAARTAAADGPRQTDGAQAAEAEMRVLKQKVRADAAAEAPGWILQDVQIAMNLYLGILRSEKTLREGLRVLTEMEGREPLYRTGHIADAEAAKNLRLLGTALFESALFRKESRGAQMRSDFPEASEEYRKTVTTAYRDGRVSVGTAEIGRLSDER